MIPTSAVPRALTGLCAAALLAVSLAGCDRAPSTSPPAATPQPVSSDAAPVAFELTRAGGIAGGTETVAVAASGAWTYTSDAKTERGTLSKDDATKLWALIHDPKLTAELKRAGMPPDCADGYEYALVVGDRRAQAIECGGRKLPPTLGAVVGLLVKATPL